MIRPNPKIGPTKTAYRCCVQLIRENDECSAIAVNLPGVVSRGESEEEALANIHEAAVAAIESYLEAGEEIPWSDTTSPEGLNGAKHKWILVNV